MSFEYVGGELKAFRYAKKWKRYWCETAFGALPQGLDAVEIGSGLGGNYETISPFVKSYRGYEPDKDLVSLAQGEHLHAKFEVGSILDIKEVLRESVLLYIDVLEHIQNDQGELEKASNLLEKGSFLVVLVPAHMELYSRFDEAIGHYRRYSKSSLESVVPKTMEILTIQELDSIGYVLSKISKKFKNSSKISSTQVRIWDSLIPISRFLDSLNVLPGKSILLVARKF